jgi:hypothetical protein
MTKLAIIHRERGKIPKITWHDPAQSPASHQIPGVNDQFCVRLARDAGGNLRTDAPGAEIAGDDLYRVLRKAEQVSSLLNSELATPGVALCESIATKSGRISVPYVPVRLGGRIGETFIDTSPRLPSSLSQFSSVSVTSGPCLFSTGTLKATGIDGGDISILQRDEPIPSKITSIEVDPELSLYEWDTITRLTFLIEGLSQAIGHWPIQVTLDVPRIQYYFYLLDANYQGLIDAETLFRWFELVDQRHESVCQSMEARLGGLRVKRAEAMRHVEETLTQSVRGGEILRVKTVSDLLASADPLWRSLLDLERPGQYNQILNLSYVYEQLQAGSGLGRGASLGVAIEHANERKTFRFSRKLAGRLAAKDGDFGWSMIGLYSKSRIFSAGDSMDMHLYLNDPGREFTDDSGRRLGVPELIDELYGTSIAKLQP